MNMETSFGGDPAEYVALDEARSRRKRILIIVAVLVAVVAAFVAWKVVHKAPPAAATDTSPSVTVIVPGRHSVTAEIPAVGNIGARRDMPVGVAGEGGVVRAVLVEPGTWVAAGQVLATVDRSVQVQQAASLAASINQARADALLAKSNLDRAKALVSRGFVSKADVDTKQAALDGANARVAVAQAQYKQQQALIGRLDIRSPTRGLVLTRAIEAGQIVGGGSGALFRIAADGKMELQARLAEGDLARVRVGAPATVTPVGTTLKIVGTIWQVSPVIDPASRQGTVRIELPYNPALRPGGFAAAEIGGGRGDVPLLPESAVLSDSKGNFVYLVGPDNKVRRRDVKIGDVDDRGVSVLSGLTGSERVVASAGAFLNEGDKVKPSLQPSPR
ncbi:efflux RND transporter periplasmic adaptor subunit [Sphingomonas crusticola]|uniref:efflux RND transporter periplasmic adaptor subunit n=1 Tax=Sphingomonas crusticola TaxID=1697973 RepID=UPI000E2360F1|nr:efflux RND transporter periplasmic adaptor subunit [Sphingomonas crusticola]